MRFAQMQARHNTKQITAVFGKHVLNGSDFLVRLSSFYPRSRRLAQMFYY